MDTHPLTIVKSRQGGICNRYEKYVVKGARFQCAHAGSPPFAEAVGGPGERAGRWKTVLQISLRLFIQILSRTRFTASFHKRRKTDFGITA